MPAWDQAAKLFGVHWNTVATAVRQAVAYGLEHREMGEVLYIGIDELSRRHEEGILAYFDERISNGAVEGMNNKAKVVSRRCCGFHTAGAYITALYHCL